ncbi:putative membrane protein [Methanolinea mesophila]|uniref:TMEM175 family protein n=1 Tax=Methanolinea mesophila TaxID=547055 RepID=UPI001AE87BE0|nr:TMEM175 family protein [Methanolinea mesophila]MBP1929035.1 putative membrane protein [Methanolinea mesophila]
MTTMPPETSPPRETLNKSRLESLSDGIFAFAMTLLVLSLTVPMISDADAIIVLPGKLAEIWPEFILFVIAFFILSGFWLSHHRILSPVNFVDEWVIRINFLVLFFVVLIPFTTSVSGDYTSVLEAVLLFHVNLLLGSLMLTLLWVYIRRNFSKLSLETLEPFSLGLSRGVIIPAVCLFAIGVSFISPQDSMWSYLLIPILISLARHWGFWRKRTANTA